MFVKDIKTVWISNNRSQHSIIKSNVIINIVDMVTMVPKPNMYFKQSKQNLNIIWGFRYLHFVHPNIYLFKKVSQSYRCAGFLSLFVVKCLVSLHRKVALPWLLLPPTSIAFQFVGWNNRYTTQLRLKSHVSRCFTFRYLL